MHRSGVAGETEACPVSARWRGMATVASTEDGGTQVRRFHTPVRIATGWPYGGVFCGRGRGPPESGDGRQDT
ncbi:hypothetical protein GCM10017744_093820 [Streptomyces antimycoticus]|uniref:Uncharacterized protein n=1 Tax=Streptomyces antimycoticus TaxID=68175 RepID=A0A4D4K087_9ACTN|nr:hypothetical protein SANT12839_005910 [Streptomyces antimycoticus]